MRCFKTWRWHGSGNITEHDDEQDIQVEFRAKIMDLAVSTRILDFPNDGEIVVRL